MTSNGTLKDGCDERHDVRFRKRRAPAVARADHDPPHDLLLWNYFRLRGTAHVAAPAVGLPRLRLTGTDIAVRRDAACSVRQNRGQNVVVQQLDFRSDHVDRLTGRIEDDDRVQLGDDDRLLRVVAHRGRPRDHAAVARRVT